MALRRLLRRAASAVAALGAAVVLAAGLTGTADPAQAAEAPCRGPAPVVHHADGAWWN